MHTILDVHMILFVRSSATILFPPNQESKREASPFLQRVCHMEPQRPYRFKVLSSPASVRLCSYNMNPFVFFITILGPLLTRTDGHEVLVLL